MSLSVLTRGGGSSGPYASIFVTGLSETDIVTASKDGVTKNGVWVAGKNPACLVPEGYTQLEWIESTGTQCVAIDYAPNPNTTMEAELLISGSFKDINTYGGCSDIFCVSDGTSQYGMNFGSAASEANKVYVWPDKKYEAGATIASIDITDDILINRNKLVVDKGSVSWGSVSESVPVKTTIHTNSLVLFGTNGDGNIKPFSAYNMRVFVWKVNELGESVRALIPTKRNSDGSIGLFDVVNGVFYPNVGTGEFIAGPEIPSYIYGHEISKIKDLGTWTVTATNGDKTTTQDVLVDVLTEYEIEMSYLLWLYNEGDECEDITGGWDAALSGSVNAPTITKNSDHINITGTLGAAGTYKNITAILFPNNIIDLTRFTTLHAIYECTVSADSYVCSLNVNPNQTVSSDDTNLVSGNCVVDGSKSTINVNVEDIDTECYCRFKLFIAANVGHTGSLNFKLYKLWLE